MATKTNPAMNARDRIGRGPWYNGEAELVAADVAQLHGSGNKISRDMALTEKVDQVNGVSDRPNQHDILTGSRPDGTAFDGDQDLTCGNWTFEHDRARPAGAPRSSVSGRGREFMELGTRLAGMQSARPAKHGRRGTVLLLCRRLKRSPTPIQRVLLVAFPSTTSIEVVGAHCSRVGSIRGACGCSRLLPVAALTVADRWATLRSAPLLAPWRWAKTCGSPSPRFHDVTVK